MKNKIRLVALLCVVIICVIILFSYLKRSQIESFSLSDYQFFLDNFPYEKHVDRIADAETAIAQAEVIWIEIYGEDVLKKKPYKSYFDSINEVWLVRGTCPDNFFGGVPYAIIQSDGNVLAIWHDK